MKKFLKTMACAMMVIAMAGIISSCKKKNSDNPVTPTDVTMEYSFEAEVPYPGLNKAEKAAFSEYLKSKGTLPLGESKAYTATTATEEECFKQAKTKAKADFDAAAQNLKVDEVRPLITTGKGFDYRWSYDTIVVSSWNCPALAIGTMVIDGKNKEVMKFKKQLGNNSVVTLMFHTENDYDAFRITMDAAEETIPVGNFNLLDYEYKALTINGNQSCEIHSGTMNIAAESNVYNFTIEGTAKYGEGKEFQFSISVKDYRIVE